MASTAPAAKDSSNCDKKCDKKCGKEDQDQDQDDQNVKSLKEKMAALAVKSPEKEVSKAAGVKTTESLSAATCTDVERWSGVTIATIQHKDGTAHVYIITGVFFQEMTPMDEVDFAKLSQPYLLPDIDYGFYIFSVNEFIEDVCKKAQHNLYWPRTKKYYTVPQWYQQNIPIALQTLRPPPVWD
jgi:hypothetical protein